MYYQQYLSRSAARATGIAESEPVAIVERDGVQVTVARRDAEGWPTGPRHTVRRCDVLSLPAHRAHERRAYGQPVGTE